MPTIGWIVFWCLAAACVGAGLWVNNRFPVYRTCATLLALTGITAAAFRGAYLLRLLSLPASQILLWCLGIGLGLFLLVSAVIGFLVIKTAVSVPPRDLPYLIVLGCVVEGTRPTRSLRERIDAAAAYLKENPQTQCVVSGAQGPRATITEAECMCRELIARGIAPERIWQEPMAKNTYENLKFSAQLIRARTGQKITVLGVTSSEYHLFRTGLLAGRQQLSICPVPAKTEKIILRLNYTLREIGAVFRMLLQQNR